MSIIERREFMQFAGAAAGALAAGGFTASVLSGCSLDDARNSAANNGGPKGSEGNGKNGKPGHHGEGHPEFKEPMNQARLVDTAPEEEEALLKLVVVSDTHVDLDYTPYADRAKNMLEDVAANITDCDLIVVNGDITNHGKLDEYEAFAQYAQDAGFAYPDDFFMVIGNHDQYDSTEGASPVSNLTDRFRQQIGIQDQVHPYYDRTVNGVHLIAMGPDRYPDSNWVHFGVTDTEVQWVDQLVAADKEAGMLSLVFLHEPLYNTVLMTMPGDFGHEWSLSEEDNNNLHEHIRKHENLVFFTGHTHAMPDTVQLPGDSPLYVGTGSIAYCLDDVTDDTEGNAEIDEYGSLGWEVTVWTSCIRFRMRNFLTHEYLPDIATVIYEF